MDRKSDKQKSNGPRAARVDLAIGSVERLALYVLGMLCLIAFLLESPVPMAIAL